MGHRPGDGLVLAGGDPTLRNVLVARAYPRTRRVFLVFTDPRIEAYLSFAGDGRSDPTGKAFWDDLVQAGCTIADIVVLRWVVDTHTMGHIAAVAARDPGMATAYKQQANRVQPLSRAARGLLEEGVPISYRYRDPAYRGVIPPQILQVAESLGIVYGFIVPLRRKNVLAGILVFARRDRPLDRAEEETVGLLAEILMPAVEKRG